MRTYFYFVRALLWKLVKITFRLGFPKLTLWFEQRTFEVELAGYDKDEMNLYRDIFGQKEVK